VTGIPDLLLQQFRYEAQTATGQVVRGTIEAASAVETRDRLAALGLRVLAVETAPDEAALPSSTAPRRRAPLGPDDFFVFNQQLAHLTAAGLPVERGLRLIAVDMKSGRLASAANAVAEELERGVPLKDAFEHHASRFPALYSQLIEAGVQAANLPSMLFNLGRHLELMTRLRRALWRAFAYPIAVLIALSAVLLFISVVILPTFRDIYKDFHTTLPALTEFTLWFGSVYPVILAVVGLFVVTALFAAKVLEATGRGSLLADQIGLRLPVVGRVLHANLIARWCDALRLGIEAGLDLPRAINLASDATGSNRLANEAGQLTAMIGAGQPLGNFRGHLLPATVPAAFELAARSGDLPATLATLGRMYEEQAEQRLRILPSLITPVLMVFIAVALGLTVAAMFLPLVKLITSVSGGS